MIALTKNQILRKIVHHSGFESLLSANRFYLAHITKTWANFFVCCKTAKGNFHEACISAWASSEIQRVRYILIGPGSPLDRARHNKSFNIKNDVPPASNFLWVPEVIETRSVGKLHNAPLKYIPFLNKIDIPFSFVVFYSDHDSIAFYQLRDNILYVNTCYNDECPMSTIHTAIGRHIVLPRVSGKLSELRYFQNQNIAPIDKFARTLEDRFVNDYAAYKLGHTNDVFLHSFLNS